MRWPRTKLGVLPTRMPNDRLEHFALVERTNNRSDLDLLDTPGARVVRVFRRLPHGSTSCDRAFQRSTGVHGLLQFLGPVFVLSRRNPPIVFGIWIAK